ncbi:unnamed protein product [Schistocephalus solidus]|uniref:Pellino FHA domain-containing protein n=1 Tax=Schistocephalus solidus TaxID=70667 RepID=A0A183TTK8_SCHSO|nr:unnamed protein product [Schistocephalus solidus]
MPHSTKLSRLLGRCAAPVIDFVLADSNPNFDDQPDDAVTPHAMDKSNGRFINFRSRIPKASREPLSSTVSRFACRINVNRNPPHEARIYAAGFDMQRNIFLGVRPLCLGLNSPAFLRWIENKVFPRPTPTRRLRVIWPAELVHPCRSHVLVTAFKTPFQLKTFSILQAFVKS